MAGNREKARKNAIKTPMPANTPNSRTGFTPDVKSVKKPNAVVRDVKNVAAPTRLYAIFMASNFSLPALISSKYLITNESHHLFQLQKSPMAAKWS